MRNSLSPGPRPTLGRLPIPAMVLCLELEEKPEGGGILWWGRVEEKSVLAE